MTHIQIKADRLPVQPIDFEGSLAEACRDEPAIPANDGCVLLVDPTTRRLIGTPIPEALSEQLRAIFERIEARGEEETSRARKEVGRVRNVADDLHHVVFEAGLIASDMRALKYLFDRALNDDEEAPAASFEAAGRIVADCMQSLAARLEALETKADAIYEPLVAERLR